MQSKVAKVAKAKKKVRTTGRKKPSREALKYLYAVIATPDIELSDLKGISDKPVYLIEKDGLAAVISNIDFKRVRPERKNLTAHQAVLNRLNDSLTPLPVSFGVIARNKGSIQKILEKNQDILSDSLALVEGKIEMSLKVKLNVPDIFAYFVSVHPELKKLRNRYYRDGRSPSHEEKLELGRVFESLLQEDRQKHTESVLEILEGACVKILENKCRDEHMVMHLSCLVERDKEETFEKAILLAAGGFNNDFNFDYSGPWVTHSFVDIHLET